jgi:Protein of unknown function (DUF2854)
MFRKIPLGLALISIGGVLTIVGFVAYATDNPTLNLAGFFYGIPVLLGGLALKSAELTPVPFSVPATPEVEALREQQATPTQNQIRNDVTRYRYGQEAHLDIALEKLGLSPTDEERPVLVGLQEIEVDKNYALVLEFDSPLIDFTTWSDKSDKIAKFFGPDIRVTIEQPEPEKVHLALIETARTPAPEVAA